MSGRHGGWGADLLTLAGESALYVTFHQVLEFLRDAVSLQSHRLLSILIHGRDGSLARTRQADTDVRVLALTGTVHYATHHRDGHILHAVVVLAPLRHAVTDVALDLLCELLEECARGSSASRACDHHGCE